MSKERKSFPLRISKEVYDEIKSWAEQEMRSVNGQIEFLLKQAVARRKNSEDEHGSDEKTDLRN